MRGLTVVVDIGRAIFISDADISIALLSFRRVNSSGEGENNGNFIFFACINYLIIT
jgi:hypothetical protein